MQRSWKQVVKRSQQIVEEQPQVMFILVEREPGSGRRTGFPERANEARFAVASRRTDQREGAAHPLAEFVEQARSDNNLDCLRFFGRFHNAETAAKDGGN